MKTSNSKAGTEVQQSTEAEVTMSSSHNAKPHVGSSEKYSNIPPKDIMNAIWGGCFDYKDFDKKVMGEPVRDRIYNAWQRTHLVIKGWVNANEKSFLEYIITHEPDIKQQLLQQTVYTTLLELLQQMLNEEQIAYMQSKNSMEVDRRLYNEDALKAVIKLIGARQPIA